MLTGFRCRLALTGQQTEQCVEFGDVCRAVWNTALDQRRQAVARWVRGFDTPYCGHHLQAGQLAEAKGEEPCFKTAPLPRWSAA